ncbi:MAG: VTT domain-containing protein [Chloroflexota bacterium]
MKNYLLLLFGLFVFILVTFLLAEASNLNLFAGLTQTMNTASIGVALIGVVTLVADIILPVPSSLVMIANGSLFGTFVGTCLSVIGSVGASAVGFWLGRQSQPLIARFVSPEEKTHAHELLREWGTIAIIATRPVPLLAETMMIAAGGSTMKWRTMLWATLAGVLPLSLLYALTGAAVANFNSMLLAFIFALVVAAAVWFLGRQLGKKQTATHAPSSTG